MVFLSIRGLDKTYPGDIVALHDLSLEIQKGERWAVIGSSGSGKSTLLRLIAGLEAQDAGEVLLDGEKIKNSNEKLVAGYDAIQLVRQDNGLYPHSTVAENIRRPLLQYDKTYGAERLESLLALFGLLRKRDAYPRQLSGGEQQKVAIARALSLEPEVLLLDEPFNSLDSLQKRDLLDELNLIFRELELTLLMVTHDIQDALLLTDRLCVVSPGGKLVRQGTIREIHQHPQSPYVAGFFGPLNAVPGREGYYLRPADVTVPEGKGKATGTVLINRYFPEHDLLTVAVAGAAQPWQVADPQRGFSQGQTIQLTWDESRVLHLPA
ncbi:iron(III) transport system ATP-binding protein/putative spermidine/putrescine transport system ATP-binding protein [Cyclobacterium xiamenense]|uniref:Iron(III) transport system ATP-binding protein/putative spermidine/putrescine transport system ATP-binding protein n=1 Tax=Cyclobacterium xiamenense TaxID=1297121 RepID=A0A1H6WS93_9BACT|nr:ABC transporter ATP-binding protein [Cyclobacterium xiamenense]SEJ18074.1 iron(III) transport system ATP-binding protein/putative spermidine/putrescine transport system ATP-binding protein [Cyclobacterium xiamenense]